MFVPYLVLYTKILSNAFEGQTGENEKEKVLISSKIYIRIEKVKGTLWAPNVIPGLNQACRPAEGDWGDIWLHSGHKNTQKY